MNHLTVGLLGYRAIIVSSGRLLTMAYIDQLVWRLKELRCPAVPELQYIPKNHLVFRRDNNLGVHPMRGSCLLHQAWDAEPGHVLQGSLPNPKLETR